MDQFEPCLFRAAMLIAFVGGLEISELVPASKHDTLLSSLHRKDVVLSEHQVAIPLPKSKTGQLRKGQVLLLGQCSECEICSVKATQEYV